MEFNVIKIVASALASITAAVAASRFGIDGTLMGAGLMSLIASVSTAFYSSTMNTTKAVAKRSLGREDPTAEGQEAATPAEGTAEGEQVPAAASSPVDPSPRSRFAWLRWEQVAAATVLIFAVSMGVITAIEAVAKEPVSVLVGAQPTGAKTSIGAAFSDRGSHQAKEDETPAGSSTSTVPEESETSATTVEPSTTAPPESTSGQPLSPTTVAPAPTTVPDSTGTVESP
jgi:hypothetical protein